jgi:acyl-CoA thioester hydrolase
MTADSITVRVYYEDTDLAGIVYYANYLRFIERGRTEYVRARGIDQARLRQDAGLVFAVRRVEADYLAPARFDDLLTVQTEATRIGGARVEMRQAVLRGDAPLFRATVTLAVLDETGRPRRLPPELLRALG